MQSAVTARVTPRSSECRHIPPAIERNAVDVNNLMFWQARASNGINYQQACSALWAKHLKGWCFFLELAIIRVAGCWKCVQGCCRVCPWVLQNVCRVTELSNIFSNFSKIFFGAKKYFKQKVATQAKSQRGLKIIHRLVQSLWSLPQSYLVVYGGA